MRVSGVVFFFGLLLAAMLFVRGSASTSGGDVLSTTADNGEVRTWEVTGPWGGDVRVLVAAPDNADLFYLGTTDGQIFRSTDGAQSWRRLKPGLNRSGLSVDHILIDPRSTSTLYAGAWAVAAGNAGAGGVFKSQDRGTTWTLLKDTKGLKVLSIALAPSDSNFLIAGASSGVFRSTDAGASWNRISPEGHPEIQNINSAAIDPQNTDVIYIGTHHLPWKTTDGGRTWKQTGYQAIGMLDDSDIMGICVDRNDPSLVYMNACSGIYRSTSAGEKWTKLPGIPFSARRTYALLPHPTDPNLIFAGTSEGLWRSRDGGKRWQLLTSKTVVIRSIVVHPSKPSRVLVATDDFGVRISNNLGDDFADSNVGFIHRHILAILADRSERGRLLASVYHDGQAGSVFLSIDGGITWEASSRGLGDRDVFALYQSPEDANIIYAGTNAGVYRSNDRGGTWSFVGMEKKTPPKKKPVRRAPRRRASISVPAIITTPSVVGRYQVVAAQARKKRPIRRPAKRKPVRKQPIKVEAPPGPVLVDLIKQVDDITSFVDKDGRHGLMAATLDGLYRTVDEKNGWEEVKIEGYSGRVYSVSNHPDTPNKIFIGTRQGLWVTFDGGASWQIVNRGPTDVVVKAIAQDPRDPDLVIVGSNQYVYRSTNGGRTWVRRGGGLPSGDFTSAIINPLNPDEILVAEYSRGGIYRSEDRGHHWDRLDREDLPSNRVWTLMFDPFERDRIYAGSFSSGVYVLTIQRGSPSAQ